MTASAPARAATLPPMMGGGVGGLAMQGAPSLRLPGQHFAAALLFLTLGAAGVVWVAPELANGVYLSPRVAGVTHCFTLGWLTMTIFGALYQLLPVALGVPIRSERVAHVSFWLYAPGVALFVAGVAAAYQPLRHAGIAFIITAVACIVINVGLSLHRAPARGVIWAAITTALSFLVVTLVLGSVLVHNLHTGFLGEWRVRVLAVHLHVALLGWVLVMIVGISHRLLPMFLLAHGVNTKWTPRALVLLALGVVVLATGLLCAIAQGHSRAATVLTWAGVASLECGLVCFYAQVALFYRGRKRAVLDAGLRHAAIALAFLATSAALAPFVVLYGLSSPRLAVVYIVVGVIGGMSLYVIGQFYKIVPFLVWIARFRDDMGKKAVPTIAQMYSARVAHCDLALFTVGVIGLVSGITLGASVIVRAAACLVFGAVALFVSQVGRVALGTPVAAATPPLAGAHALAASGQSQ